MNTPAPPAPDEPGAVEDADRQHVPERRKSGRRRSDRSGSPPLARDESWFGALGVSSEGSTADDDWSGDAPGRFDPRATSIQSTDSRFLSRQARRLVNDGNTAFGRIYATFVTARAALALALLGAQLVAELFGARPPLVVLALCTAYGLQAFGTWLAPRWWGGVVPPTMTRLRPRQWVMTIGFDLVCFSLLQLLAPNAGLNYVPLLALPVLMAGVLTPLRSAMATTALVVMVLLGTAWMDVAAGGEPSALLTQAGLMGSGLFALALLSGELSSRLAREELTARGSLELARQQAQLNRLVIEEMQDGVIVVDRKGRVRAANPAARRLLAPTGLADPAPFQLRGVEAWEPLVRAMERAFVEASWPEAGRDLTLGFAPGLSRTLRVRVRFTRRREPQAQAAEEFCVLFFDDVRSVQARTRQEKLAAMGRVSAGIAHEIRNPLAAIAQANALLAEDATTSGQRRLTQMVSDNVERLKRIVDDVMEVAPSAPPMAAVIDITAIVRDICGEWSRTAGVRPGDGGLLRIELPGEPIGAVFDPEHLRRVLVNLLDNARRHGGDAPGAVIVRLESRDDRHAVLSVISGGEPIAPEVERYLFEPFFSTRSRGTGLGLYICRELCERYGASIDYRQRPPTETHRNQFVVVVRRDTLPAAPSPESRSLFSA